MIHFLLPGPLDRPTGGTVYDRRMVEGLRARGRAVTVHEVAEAFPHPSVRDLAAAEAVLTALPAGAVAVVDGLALGVMPQAAARAAAAGVRLVALVHHPLALESGLDAATTAAFRQAERAALAAARRVIVTSPTTGAVLARDYGVAAEDIRVVIPGTDPAPVARGGGAAHLGPGAVALLAVGALVPRKGHALLVEALRPLAGRPWHLTIAGPERDPATGYHLRSLIGAAGLTDRITLTGAVSDAALAALYDAADLFVLASLYEGYGMVFSEAVARGLPIVATTGGAIAATVPAGAGLLVPPGDAAALGAALARLMETPAERARLRARAVAARHYLPTWPARAAAFAAALEDVA